MALIPITEAEIICTFASFKNKSSSGYDGVSNTILESCGKFLGKPLAYIFNKSSTVLKFLEHLKYFVVNPLFEEEKGLH